VISLKRFVLPGNVTRLSLGGEIRAVGSRLVGPPDVLPCGIDGLEIVEPSEGDDGYAGALDAEGAE